METDEYCDADYMKQQKSMIVDFKAPEVQQPTTRGLLLGFQAWPTSPPAGLKLLSS